MNNLKILKFRNFCCVSILLAMQSCGCEQTYLSLKEKAWCSVYKEGEELIFQSNQGSVDTLTITKTEEGLENPDCNRMIGKTQRHYLLVNFKSSLCPGAECESSVRVIKSKQDKLAYPHLNIFGLQYYPRNENYHLITKAIILKITNKKYLNAFYFEDDYNAKHVGPVGVNSFYWDIRDGLVQYSIVDGEIFELIKK